VVIGSIALPLTAGFIGEFLMITGLFGQSVWFAVVGGLTMILGTIYMLYAYQRVMLGNLRTGFEKIDDLIPLNYFFLVPLILVIFCLGIYPQPVFNLIGESVSSMQNLLIPVTDTMTTIVH